MIFLYNKDLRPVCPLSSALRVGFEEKINDLTTASLEMSAEDENNDLIVVPASFARIYDGSEDLGFFRFSSIPRDEHAPSGEIRYTLQSAACTLLDDLLVGWHEIGGTEISTRQVLEYILARQTKTGTQRWVLGVCDFEDFYQYNFEDVTLLEAIMSLGEVLLEPYRFVFDSTTEPWTMHLVRESDTAMCALTYRRNMTRMRRSVDGRVVTRLYGRGYGEGDNQLTIASVNGGKDYLDAPPEVMARWGIRCGVHVDTRQTDPATLKAHMEQILAGGQMPTYSYESDAIDLWHKSGQDWDHVKTGPRVMMLDETLGGTIEARVTGRKKDDVDGDPGSVQYTLDNNVSDTAEEINEIRDKIGIHELYSQGATNMYSMQNSENADETHPLVMRFYVPGNVLRINSCLMAWEIEPFRTHVTVVKADGSGIYTSKAGGGATVTLPEQTLRVEMSSGDAVDADGGVMDKTSTPINDNGAEVTRTGASGMLTSDFSVNAEGTMTQTGSAGAHKHTVDSHTHSISIGLPGHGHLLGTSSSQTGGLVSVPDISGATGSRAPSTSEDEGHSHAMTHYHEIQSHTHAFAHRHAMDHLHSITHEHIIPPMRFTLEGHSHSVEIPEHEHELEYGIYEGARAETVSLRVDGVDVPEEAIGEARELDILPYLAKNDAGKVTRGTFHKVEFVPSGLTRLTANLFFQVFIQSRGAGDF